MSEKSLQKRLKDCDNLFCPACDKETPHDYSGLKRGEHHYKCKVCKSTHNDEQINEAVLKAYGLNFKK